jgi:hypothetical protein
VHIHSKSQTIEPSPQTDHQAATKRAMEKIRLSMQQEYERTNSLRSPKLIALSRDLDQLVLREMRKQLGKRESVPQPEDP